MEAIKIKDVASAREICERDISMERVRGRWIIKIGDEPPAIYINGKAHAVSEIC